MTFAIIQTGAKQYKVKEKDIISIEKLQKEYKKDEKITFENIVLIDDGKTTQLGKPFIPNKTVEAVFIEEYKGDKIRIQKFKSKSNYKKIQGHRQNYFKVQITKI